MSSHFNISKVYQILVFKLSKIEIYIYKKWLLKFNPYTKKKCLIEWCILSKCSLHLKVLQRWPWMFHFLSWYILSWTFAVKDFIHHVWPVDAASDQKGASIEVEKVHMLISEKRRFHVQLGQGIKIHLAFQWSWMKNIPCMYKWSHCLCSANRWKFYDVLIGQIKLTILLLIGIF